MSPSSPGLASAGLASAGLADAIAAPFGAQHTLAAPVTLQGVGLHSGARVTVRLCPAALGTGRVFQRVDLPEQPTIPARLVAVGDTTLSTELRSETASIRTVEHLLAAIASLGIHNAVIEVDGPEIPLLDGSARDWLTAIQTVGLTDQGDAIPWAQVSKPVQVQSGDAFVAAFPAPSLRFSYGIDFAQTAIGNQWHSIDFTPQHFIDEVASARTFGFAEQVEQLRSLGLIKGGSLENALVCSETGWVNPPLRYANEPARHKLLDLIGDLSLLGVWPQAHILAYKASHRLHTEFAEILSAVLKVSPSVLNSP